MAEEKDTAAPAKRTAGKTGRRKKPEAEHAARAAPMDKDTGSKAQEILEQARTAPKPEWEVAEQVVLLPLDRLRPFKNHPFKVNDEDELMQDTIDSIMAGGVINPILVRPAEDGKFEVVSGHRRFRASELAGKADIKAIIREMDDDTAVITMVDSNLQRENILPSERAFSYRMKMEALTHQGQRTDPTLRQVGAKFRTAELVGQPAGDSARQVQRFIRLTELIPQLLDMVDRKELAFNPAVELSYLKPQEQEQFLDAMDYAQATPSLSQAQRLKRLSQNGQCTLEAMYEIMDEEKKSELDRITIRGDVLRKYFPKSYTPLQMQETIIKLLEAWQKNRAHQQEAPFFRDPVTLVCNEEGKISGLPLNRAIRDDDGKIIDVVAGTFFICGAEGDHFSSIPKELQKKYEEKFKKPEAFLKMGRSIMAIPTEPAAANPKPDKKAPGMEL